MRTNVVSAFSERGRDRPHVDADEDLPQGAQDQERGGGGHRGAQLQGHQRLRICLRQGRALGLRYAGRGGGMRGSPAEASTASGLPPSGLSSWSQVCWERGAVWGAHL